jgi:hypothetical protein
MACASKNTSDADSSSFTFDALYTNKTLANFNHLKGIVASVIGFQLIIGDISSYMKMLAMLRKKATMRCKMVASGVTDIQDEGGVVRMRIE